MLLPRGGRPGACPVRGRWQVTAAAASMPQTLPPVGNPYGVPLEGKDYRDLAARWIDRKHADAALLKRVPDHEGRDHLGQPRKDCSGLFIPYLTPDVDNMRAFRIRRDHPEMESGKPTGKYLTPRGQRNCLYFMPGTEPAALKDPSIPIILTEGEFKTIALARLACHNTAAALFLPVGISGVWNWKGVIGKTTDANGARVDEKGVIPDISRIEWQGRRVTIAFDADSAHNSQVKAARYMLSRELRSRGAEVGFLEWNEARGKGIDDWLANDGPEAVLKAIDAVDFNRTTGWRAKLKCSEGGKPKPLLMNADIALRYCPAWEGVLAFDEFRQKVRIIAPAPIGGEVPRDWNDADDTRAAIWMQGEGIELGRDIVGAAVQAIALENTVHPLRDWLLSVHWDGTGRVDTWLTEFLGAKPSEYVASVGRMWLISAVARVMKPGCKVDTMLILESPQGRGKSRALRILAGDEYFCDSMPDIRNKDAQLQLFGSWIIEWGELDAMSRAETTAVKDFVSRQTEKLRRPYGRHTEEVPRQCVFAGTTNKDDYLKDETGNRRFWPVKVGRIDCERLAEDREQIWAEAVALYQDGSKWWPERAALIEAAAAEQAQRVEVDPWLPAIKSYTAALKKVRAEYILKDLGRAVQDMTQGDRNRVGRCLRVLGFMPKYTRDAGRCFVKEEQCL